MKNIIRTTIMALGLIPVGLSGAVSAEEILNGDQVKTLFSNKTFDGQDVIKDRKYRVYSSTNATMKIVYSRGVTKTRYWLIDDKGRHCVSKEEGKKGKCSVVIGIGGGVYKKITNDKHSHTMKNYVDGNQL